MKIGIRKPSLKRSFSAMTKGRLKREIKRSINPFYGKKGIGWIKNPKKAAYNKIYNKTTISARDLFAPSKRSSNQSSADNMKSNLTKNHVEMDLNSKDTKIGCISLLLIIIVFAMIVVSITSCSENQKKNITYESLIDKGHPVVYDDYKEADEFYCHYQNVYVGSVQTYDLEDENAAVLAMLSQLEYDKIYDINIYLNKLEYEFSLDEALDIAVSYIPVEMILERFDFEKAIYKLKDDGKKQYECYYRQKTSGVENPGLYYDGTSWVALQEGFSLVIEETIDDSYVIRIGDDWYDYLYQVGVFYGGGYASSDALKKEQSTHHTWDFHL